MDTVGSEKSSVRCGCRQVQAYQAARMVLGVADLDVALVVFEDLAAQRQTDTRADTARISSF